MTEVGSADRKSLLKSRKAEWDAIVASRKRKLRQLWAVATTTDGVPDFDLSDPDANLHGAEERKFLDESDIKLGRKFNERSIPDHIFLDVLRLYRDGSKTPEAGNHVSGRSKKPLENGIAHASSNVASSPSDGSVKEKAFCAVSEQEEATSEHAPREPSLRGPQASAERAKREQTPSSRPSSSKQNGLPETGFLPSAKPQTSRTSPTPNGIDHDADTDAAEGVERDERPAEDRRMGPMSDIGPQHGQPGLTHGGAAKQLPPSESTRLPEAPSSPGSSTQTGATSAAHDRSTDTSPEQDESGEPDIDAVEHGKATETGESGLFAHGPSTRPIPGRGEGLQEKAPERDAQSGDVEPLRKESPCPRKPEQPSVSITESLPASEKREAGSTVNEASHVQPTRRGTEIPDSEESSQADAMDIDKSPKGAQQDSAVEKGREVAVQQQQPPGDAMSFSKGGAARVSSDGRPKETAEATATGVPIQSVESSTTAHPTAEQQQPTPITPTQGATTPRSTKMSKGKERTHRPISKVVFGKQPQKSDDTVAVKAPLRPGQLPTDDYFVPLFIQGFAQTSKWMKPMDVLVTSAHKCVSSDDTYIALQDYQVCRILRRVYHLQGSDKWTLRQPARCPEPTRPPSHWDTLLQEARWMRTDFREERKWKMAMARNLAYACQEVALPLLEKQYKREEQRKAAAAEAEARRQTQDTDGAEDVSMSEALGEASQDVQSVPDLVGSGRSFTPVDEDEPRDSMLDAVPPSAIFALDNDEVIFELRQSPAADRLLEELPMYCAPLQVPKGGLVNPEFDPDETWRRPALPLSKYVEGRMKIKENAPPRKRKRYQFETESEDEEGDKIYLGGEPEKGTPLPPQDTTVALFRPEMKQTRDRLHAGQQFRPPSEYPMPQQSFYECRAPSHWTLADDDELRMLVREYSYNWSLVSSLIAPKSRFASAYERRTPWECFERWIQLEGIPNEMQKAPYFRAYHHRIESANRNVQQQNQAAAAAAAAAQQQQQQQQQQQNQAGGSSTPLTPVRRRSTTSIRVERRSSRKHLSMLDAMRKLAKKREAAAQKAHNAATLAAIRKTNEVQQPKGPNKTPQDYSHMRYERDKAVAEKLAEYKSRQEAQRRAAMQARAAQQGQAAQLANAGGIPMPPAAAAAHLAAANPLAAVNRPGMPNQLAIPGQPRPRMPMQAPANAMGIQGHMASGLVPPMAPFQQAQLAALQGAPHRMAMGTPQPDLQLVMQARRISEQQRQAVAAQQQAQQQAQQAQQAGQHHPGQVPQTNGTNSPQAMRGVNGLNQQSFMANNAAAAMASLNAASAAGMMGSPAAAGLSMPAMPAGSPRAHIPGQFPPHLIVQITAVEAQLRAKNPGLTPEQARQLATQHVTALMIRQQQHQSAMNAAAGVVNSGMALPNGIPSAASPQHYAQLLRAQQQQQQQHAASQAAQAAQAAQASQQRAQSAQSSTASAGK